MAPDREEQDDWANQRRRDQVGQANEAERLAEQRGMEKQRLDSTLAAHSNRLDVVEKAFRRQTEIVTAEIQQIKTAFQDFKADQDKRDAVADERAKAVKDASDKMVSTRMFLLGVGMLLVAIVALFVSSGHVG